MRTVSHVIRLTEALAADGPRGVSDLARALGLDKATAHRVLRALQRGGWVVQDERSRKYALGPAPVGVVARGDRDGEFVRRAIPVVEELGRQLDETVMISVRCGLRNVVEHVRESSQEVRVASHVGRALELHCGAAGKVLLAFAPPAVRDEVLALPLRRFTANTIVEPGSLRDELARTRERGWGMDNEEFSIGVRGLAAPVEGAGGAIRIAITVRAPTSRLRHGDIRSVAAQLVAAARAISALDPPL